MTLTLLLFSAAAGLAYLIVEGVRLGRKRGAIPLLVSVTGTRGKSSVTRMLASILRESGRQVLAKTTGSEALLIFPDGREQEIRRRGAPSIIEQKRLVHLGADLGVDAVVAEVMSIHRENHWVESRQLLQPGLVVATNFRVDHVEATGDTPEEVAAVLALDVPDGAKVMVSEGEGVSAFRAAVEKGGGEVVEVPSGSGVDNLDLVIAAARSLGADESAIQSGIRNARQDVGAFGAWRYPVTGAEDSEPSPCVVVNAFAANDPESTTRLYDWIGGALNPTADQGPRRTVGLMSLRADRGERTLQWIDALVGGFLGRFDRLFVCGIHASALKRRLEKATGGSGTPIQVCRAAHPAEMMGSVLAGVGKGATVVFGFGNIGGVGEELVRHWRRIGEPVSLGEPGSSAIPETPKGERDET